MNRDNLFLLGLYTKSALELYLEGAYEGTKEAQHKFIVERLLSDYNRMKKEENA
jgi:hypothetical protein